MGLDMGLYVKDKEAGDDNHDEEIAYWRKHADLNGYMCDLMQREKPSITDCNCEDFYLTEELIDEIIGTLTMRLLPKGSQGFFWGQSSHTDEEMEADLEVFERAKELVQEGEQVYYSANW